MFDDVMAPLWQRCGVKNWLIRREKSRRNGENVRDTSLFCPQPGAKAPPSSKDAHQKPLKDCGGARTRIIWGLRGDHSPHRSHRPARRVNDEGDLGSYITSDEKCIAAPS